MNPNLAEIAFILDCSGSMQLSQESAVAAFNAFVNRKPAAFRVNNRLMLMWQS